MLSLILSSLITALPQASVEEGLTVLEGRNDSLLYDYLMEQVNKQYELRKAEIREAPNDQEKMSRRIQSLRRKYREIIGPFPEKTPLNAKITGNLPGEGFRIEKVVYESRPDHHVTANITSLPVEVGHIPEF